MCIIITVIAIHNYTLTAGNSLNMWMLYTIYITIVGKWGNYGNLQKQARQLIFMHMLYLESVCRRLSKCVHTCAKCNFSWILSFLAWPLMWVKGLDYLSWQCQLHQIKQSHTSKHKLSQILTGIMHIKFTHKVVVLQYYLTSLMFKYVHHHCPGSWQWQRQVTLSHDCQA